MNSSLHVIVCGRAGYEFDMVEDDDTRKKQLEKTGIKMKAEGEMGYEPDLLVLMERRMNMVTKSDEHIAHVLKDRSTLLDGKEFAEPTFESFLPHIRCLNLGGRQLGVDTSRTSASLIPADPRDNRIVRRKIVLDEIADLLTLHHGSNSAADRQERIKLCRKHFGAVWGEMETVMPLERLRAGYDTLHLELENVPSRYHVPPLAINDGLPPTVSHESIMEAATEPLDHTDHGGLPAFLDRRKAVNGAIESSFVDLVGGADA